MKSFPVYDLSIFWEQITHLVGVERQAEHIVWLFSLPATQANRIFENLSTDFALQMAEIYLVF